jgi:hypothetical protein
MHTRIRAALLLAGLCVDALAHAQSHSVTNYSNPPGTTAASKAATEATPGLSATADQQDLHHPDKGSKDARANKDKAGQSAKAAHSAARRRPASKEAAKGESEGASASVYLDGASKGGAEATMQNEPSERENDAVKHAFDSTPTRK